MEIDISLYHHLLLKQLIHSKLTQDSCKLIVILLIDQTASVIYNDKVLTGGIVELEADLFHKANYEDIILEFNTNLAVCTAFCLLEYSSEWHSILPLGDLILQYHLPDLPFRTSSFIDSPFLD